MLLLRDEDARDSGAALAKVHLTELRKVFAGEQDMAALYNAKLARTLEACSHSKLYAGRIVATVENGDAAATLAELPLLAKRELSDHRYDAFTRKPMEFVHYYESSGTLGDPVAAPKALDDLIVNTMNIGEMWARVITADDTALILINAPFAPAAYQFEKVLEYLGVMSLRPWVDNITGDYRRVLRLLADLSVNVFVGPPSRLLEMVQFALRHKLPIPRFDHLFLIAEQTGPSFLRHLERLTGARAYVGCYGTSETGTIAVTCEQGQLHLQTQSYLLELRTADGITALQPGGRGELVVTTLDLPARPLLRYCPGDLVEVDKDHCGCGLALPVVRTLGRTQDVIALSGLNIRQNDVEAALWPADSTGPSALNYMLVIKGDSVVTLLMTDGPVDDDWTARAEQRLSPLFHRYRLSVRPVEMLPPLASLGGYLGWKLSRVLDLNDARLWDRLPAPIATVLRETLGQVDSIAMTAS